MMPNFDFLEIGDKKRFEYERVLLSAELLRFQAKGETESCQVVITKRKFFILKSDLIERDVPLNKIEAVTTSVNSDEFVIHVENSVDERFSCIKNKSEILQMILYLQTSSGIPGTKVPSLLKHISHVHALGTTKQIPEGITKQVPEGTHLFSPDTSIKMKVYMVPDLSLDLYLTTPEDIEQGHVLRPDEKHRKIVNFKEFIELESKYAVRKEQRCKSTRTIYAKQGNKPATIEDFELLKTLGKGAHGKVLLCERRDSKNERYALKIIKKQHIIDSNQLEHTIAEKVILSCLTHPFLVSLKQAFQNEHKVYFVMEFMKGGELFQHLRKVKRFTEEQAKFITGCIITALGHLHNKDYIYRDLKPENVLLDEKGFAKLTDFGLAKHLSVSDIAKTFCGTPEYLAPEIILDKGCNRPADWWSLGVLVYELLFGVPPFYSKDVQEMYKKTLLNPLKFSGKIMISPEAKDFIAGLLVKAPGKRLGSIADSLEVMNHPWFKDFNWAKLLDKNMTPPYNPMAIDWEKNFDQVFTKEPAKDSFCTVDPAIFDKYNSQFKVFDYDGTENELVEVSESLLEQPAINSSACLTNAENETASLGLKFKETLQREASLLKQQEISEPAKNIENSDCTKKLNFGEDLHNSTPDTLSDNCQTEGVPGLKQDSHSQKNSFDISETQMQDFDTAFYSAIE